MRGYFTYLDFPTGLLGIISSFSVVENSTSSELVFPLFLLLFLCAFAFPSLVLPMYLVSFLDTSMVVWVTKIRLIQFATDQIFTYNTGGLRCLVPCSNAYPSSINFPSLKAWLVKVIPTGSPSSV